VPGLRWYMMSLVFVATLFNFIDRAWLIFLDRAVVAGGDGAIGGGPTPEPTPTCTCT